MNYDIMQSITVLIIAFTCVGVFVATAIATVLNLFNILRLEKDIRTKLHAVLLVEIVGISIAAFAGFINPQRVVRQLESTQKENTESKVRYSLIEAAVRGTKNKGHSLTPLSASDLSAIQKSAQNASSVSLQGAKILWVDDDFPQNNTYERAALETLGVTFDLAKNTQEARNYLLKTRYSAIISDFKREDDPRAGYTLLEAVKKTIMSPPPYIIYSGSASSALVAEAMQRGAFGETNSPQELFELVIDAIKRRPSTNCATYKTFPVSTAKSIASNADYFYWTEGRALYGCEVVNCQQKALDVGWGNSKNLFVDDMNLYFTYINDNVLYRRQLWNLDWPRQDQSDRIASFAQNQEVVSVQKGYIYWIDRPLGNLYKQAVSSLQTAGINSTRIPPALAGQLIGNNIYTKNLALFGRYIYWISEPDGYVQRAILRSNRIEDRETCYNKESLKLFTVVNNIIYGLRR